MSLWDDLPATYTSFTPLASESQSSNSLLSRFFKRGKDDSDQSSDSGSIPSSREVSVERLNSRHSSADRQFKVEDDQSEQSKKPKGLPNKVVRKESFSSKTHSGEDDRSDTSRRSSEADLPESQDTTKRTFSSVITRLSTILERRAPTPQVYRDSDFKQYWMPDSSCKECYDCGDKFTTFRRRHHCRICGQIFCNGCCNQELSGKIIGYKGSIRVCTYCYQIVQKYAQKASPSGDPKVTKESLDRCLETAELLSPERAVKKRSSLDVHSSLNLRSPGDSDTSLVLTAPFDLTPQSEFVADNFTTERRLLIQDSTQLRNLWSLMLDAENGVEFQSYRFRLRAYPKCIAGNKLVDWLLKQDKVANRIQAVAIGQALIDADYLDPVLNVTTPFRDDFTLYKPTDITAQDTTLPIVDNLDDIASEDSAPQWFQEIQDSTQDAGHVNEDGESGMVKSNSHSDLSQDSMGKIKVDDNHFDDPVTRTMPSEDVSESMFGVVPDVLKSSDDQVASSSWKTLSITTDNTQEKTTFERIQQDHHEHLTILTKQLLSEEGLSTAWADIIISTVDRVSLFVKPDVRSSSDDADIRKYVHIKKVPGDKRAQTGLVHGVVFNKNIAHKKMKDNIQNPRVFLLEGTIEYQRVENKMSSLQPQILQEEEFLRKIVAKIAALNPKPEVLVVEKSVSRLAQDCLLKHGITLIYNVKRSVMERLSRFLQTDIATSVDSSMRGQTNRQTLGFCHTFSVRSYKLPSGDTKNMICFDGCATHLGCAIILRGGTLSELKRVKKIINFMIYASYHSRLETAFCMDEFLKPASIADSIEDFDLVSKDDDDVDDDVEKTTDNSSGTNIVTTAGVKSNDLKSTSDQSFDIVNSGEENSYFDVIETSYVEPTEAVYSDNSDIVVCDREPTNAVHKEDSGKLDLDREPGEDVDSENSEKLIGEREPGKDMDSINSDKLVCAREPDAVVQIENSDELNEENCKNGKGKQLSKSGTNTHERMSSFIRCDTIDENDLETGDDIEVQFSDQSDLGSQKTQNHSNLVCDTIENKSNQSDEQYKIDGEGAVSKDVNFNETGQNTTNLVLKKSESSDNASVSCQTLAPEYNGISTEHSPMTRPKNDHRKSSELSSANKVDRTPYARRQSEVIQLTDRSDPLHNYQINQDESIFQSSLAFQEQLQSHRFKLKKCLENVALSVSPYVKYDLPYLETETGSKCELRPYFPEEIYWSSHFGYKNGESKPRFKYQDDMAKKYQPPSNIKITEAHDFIKCQLNRPACDKETQYMLAKYRAYGGRINVVNKSDIRNHVIQNGGQTGKGRQFSGDNTNKGDNSYKDIGVMWEKKVDCLDPFRHQRLAVLFSSFSYESENHPNPCVYPWVVTMDFYGRNDITLGGFLERFCFRQSYVCPSDSCNTPMEKHIRRFVHGQGSVSVVLKKVNKPLKDGQTNILLWSWCHKCKQVTPVVPLSVEAWHMSFAKYLEFRFHGDGYKCRTSIEPCTHSLHHDHFQYFGFNDMVASFKYSTIKLKELKLPPLVISKVLYLEVIELYRVKDEVKRLTMKITEQFSSIFDFMTRIKAETNCEHLIRLVNENNAHQQSERTVMRELAHTIRDKVNILLKQSEERKMIILNTEQKQIYDEVEDDMTRLKRKMAEAVLIWNNKLQDLYVQQKKSKQTSTQKKDREKDSISINSSVPMEIEDKESKSVTSSIVQSSDLDASVNSPISVSGDIFNISGQENRHRRQKSDISLTPVTPPVMSSLPSSLAGSLDILNDDNLIGPVPFSADDTLVQPIAVNKDNDHVDPIPIGKENKSAETVPISTEKQVVDSMSVGKEKNLFDAMPISTEKKPVDSRPINTEKKVVDSVPISKEDKFVDPIPVGTEKKVVESIPINADNKPVETIPINSEKKLVEPTLSRSSLVEPSSVNKENRLVVYTPIAFGNKLVEDNHPKVEVAEDAGISGRLAAPGVLPARKSPADDQMDGSTGDKIGALKKTLINTIWQASGAYQLVMPFDPCEHYLLPQCLRLPVVVYDHEPSSIISYSLSCSDYQTKLYEIQTTLTQSQKHMRQDQDSSDKSSKDDGSPLRRPNSGKLSFFKGGGKDRAEQPDAVRYIPRPDSGSLESPQDEADYSVFTASTSESADKSKSVKHTVNSHIELQFSDNTARFYCKIYFAEQFRQLRKLIFPEGEDAYIRSISRCKPWEAKGGKSGSSFCKTDDDRFILKQMSGMEVESFEKFGPKYFQYISKTEKQQRPTALAKIVGVYRIGFRNQQTNNAMKQDLIIMENLFYDRNISQTFDLKGSERNRLVKTTRKADEELVLLDENFLRVSVDCPLYMLPHSKTMLMMAIGHDSHFLSSNLVMDYSLLVGLDEQRKELVVGIIDYIRTFTWDKKLETILKSNFGGQGKMPTVVSPEVYRTRFLDAMGKYFLSVPDQWSGLGKDVDI